MVFIGISTLASSNLSFTFVFVCFKETMDYVYYRADLKQGHTARWLFLGPKGMFVCVVTLFFYSDRFAAQYCPDMVG